MQVDRLPTSQDAVVPDSRPSSPETEVGGDDLDIDHSGDPLPPSPPKDDDDDDGLDDGMELELNSAASHSDIELEDWESRMQRVTGIELDIPIKPKKSRLSRGSASDTSSRRSSLRQEPQPKVATRSTLDKGKGREQKKRESSASTSSRKRAGSLMQSERKTPEDSGESSGVEVTSARSKPKNSKRRSRSPSGTPLEDKAEGTSQRRPKPVRIGRGRPPTRVSSGRHTRSATNEQFEEELPPPLAHVEAVKQEFVPLSTGTDSLDADDIIAQLRAKTMARLGQIPAASKPDMQLGGDTVPGGVPMDEDSDDDDLADPSLLLKAAAIRPAKPIETESRRSSRQSLPVVKPESRQSSKAQVRLPSDRSKYSLASMAKARQAESDRGWSGIGGATNMDGDEDPSLQTDATLNGQERSSSEDSDLPDISLAKSSSASRHRRPSDGAMKRVAGALGTQDQALKAVQSAKVDLAELDRKKQEEEALERRRFWEADFEMTIEVRNR